MKQFETQIGGSIEQAVHYLGKDELVSIPTETVYGLAANAFSERAIEKVFKVKQRPSTNPLIVHVKNSSDILHLVRDMPGTARALLERFSPGPLTVILKKNSILPAIVSAGRPDVAFRIPAHSLTLSLLQAIDFPLVAPSANLYTTISPTNPQHVVKNLYGKIPYVLDGGNCEVGIESTVVGFDEDETPVIYRQGAITPDDIKLVAGRVRINGNETVTIAPGMSKLHYSPKTPLYLMEKFRPMTGYHSTRTGILCFDRHYGEVPVANQFVLSAKGDLNEAARNVYKGLHYLDDLGLDVLIAEMCPAVGVGKSINDRLIRAAYQADDKKKMHEPMEA